MHITLTWLHYTPLAVSTSCAAFLPHVFAFVYTIEWLSFAIQIVVVVTFGCKNVSQSYCLIRNSRVIHLLPVPIFPAANVVSPVADRLKDLLARVNWARAGLGLPLVSKHNYAPLDVHAA
mgnify:FL=1